MTKYKNPCRLVCKYNEEHLCMGCDRTREEIKYWPDYNDEKRKEIFDLIIKRGGNPYKKKRYDI
ncbi:MAG: DUF1289 domain-containing protein [Bacteroidetes bacterium]|nr:MAG: DUF1289 domain-containing protein [Bacteroidota bacterium]